MKLVVQLGIVLLCSIEGLANPALFPNELSQDAVNFSPDPFANCRSGYNQPYNSNLANCYKVYTDFKSRKDAASQCQADNGFLSAVPSSYVNSYLNFLATQADATSIWLGVTCLHGTLSSCTNDDQTSFWYNNFNSGEPDSSANCVYMSTHGANSQQWSSFHCEQRFAFACEVPVGTGVVTTTSVKPSTQTPSGTLGCPQGYDGFNGVCYQFVSVLPNRISANEASSRCQRISGGKLAIASNYQVNHYLAVKVPNTNSYVAFGLRCPAIAYTGDTSSCYWRDGTTFGWNSFMSGHPVSQNGSDCCDFYYGNWDNCHSCNDAGRFDAYLCQAPYQNVGPTTSTTRQTTSTTKRQTATSPTPAGTPHCPQGYDRLNDLCYQFVSVLPYRTSASEASSKCQRIAGGDLAIVPNYQVNQFLAAKVNGANSFVAFGLRCPNVRSNGDKSSCYWNDGTPFLWNNFDSGHPTSVPGSDCCDFYRGNWYNCHPCYNSTVFDAYLCQAPLQNVGPTTSTTTRQPITTTSTTTRTTPSVYYGCPNGYNNYNGMCYQFVSVLPYKISAADASSNCRQISGGNLATVSNYQVNQYLSSTQQSRNSVNNYVAFGLRCPAIRWNGDTSSCYWNDGTAFGYYNNFALDHPFVQYGADCCDFNGGNWYNCFACNDTTRFDAYICQAPFHPGGPTNPTVIRTRAASHGFYAVNVILCCITLIFII